VRLTIRQMMLAVVIVALVLWAKGAWERRVYCLRRAAYWAGREREALKREAVYRDEPSEFWRNLAAIERTFATKCGRLRLTYEIGAAHPWSPVIPNPEEYRGRVWPKVGFIAEGLEGE
jgi:hypothetical protein